MGQGHLRLEDFESLLDRNPEIDSVELSNYGEMFLNPRLADLLRVAHERKVTVHADNGVNLNHAGEAALEAVVRYGMRSLSCSIDGASQEPYARYRVNGQFERVIENIRRINALKRRYRTGLPALNWQFVVFGHNEHEIAAARALAAELGMTFRPKISWDSGFSPVRDRELVRIQTGETVVTREEYLEREGRAYGQGICAQLWQAPALNWDGRLMGCCRNFWQDFGVNVFETTLDEAVNSERIEHARAMLLGRAEPRADVACTTCEIYESMRARRHWLTRQEVEPAAAQILVSLVADFAPEQYSQAEIALFEGHVPPIPAAFYGNPQRRTLDLRREWACHLALPKPGDYTIAAVATRRDPAANQAAGLISKPIRVEIRPACQEFRVGVEDIHAAAAEPVRTAAVGRNDGCPCGSGKKFKRCCGA